MRKLKNSFVNFSLDNLDLNRHFLLEINDSTQKKIKENLLSKLNMSKFNEFEFMSFGLELKSSGVDLHSLDVKTARNTLKNVFPNMNLNLRRKNAFNTNLYNLNLAMALSNPIIYKAVTESTLIKESPKFNHQLQKLRNVTPNKISFYLCLVNAFRVLDLNCIVENFKVMESCNILIPLFYRLKLLSLYIVYFRLSDALALLEVIVEKHYVHKSAYQNKVDCLYDVKFPYDSISRLVHIMIVQNDTQNLLRIMNCLKFIGVGDLVLHLNLLLTYKIDFKDLVNGQKLYNFMVSQGIDILPQNQLDSDLKTIQ
jgi:hypothetical protein